MNKLIRLLSLSAIAAAFALPALAQTPQASPAASPAAATSQANEEAKAAIYKRWLDNRKGTAEQQKVAYEAGKEYLQKYGAEKDQYFNAVNKWVTNYEGATREFNYRQAVEKSNYAEAFRLGREILAANPNRVDVQMNLAWAGYLASVDKNDAHVSDAANYAQQAIKAIESGRQPMGTDASGKESVSYWIFPSKDDALGGLHFAVGSFMTKQSKHDEAARAFHKAAQFSGFTKKEPSTYANLAGAYELSQYKVLADQYRNATTADPAAAEKPEVKAILARLEEITDRIIDAYARAIAYATDAKYAAQKEAWRKKMTALYKFRHNDSEAGLNELIAGITSKPLPPIDAPAAPATDATTTTTSSATPAAGTTTPAASTTTGTASGATATPAPTGSRVNQTTTTTTTTTTAKPAQQPGTPTNNSGNKPKP